MSRAQALGSQRAGPPRGARGVQRLAAWLLRLFFRRIDVEGQEFVPSDRGGLLVAWHPNGLVDPALILGNAPRPVWFGARHGLFGWPVLGFLLRRVAVPIYRSEDAATRTADAVDTQAERRLRNDRSLGALSEALVQGRLVCLFPEGRSHDAPHLLRLRTGAARLFERAMASHQLEQAPVVVPVGLYYDRKHLFRSSALVRFYPPWTPPPELVTGPASETEDARLVRLRRFTEGLEHALEDVVHSAEDWEVHHLLHRVRRLLRAERAGRAITDPGRPDLREKTLAFERVWRAYRHLRDHAPDELARLRRRVTAYDADLMALHLDDHELDVRERSFARTLLRLSADGLAISILAPLWVMGALWNGPPSALIVLLARFAGRDVKDRATIKLLAGVAMLPAFWIAIGFFATSVWPLASQSTPSLPPHVAPLASCGLGLAGGLAVLRAGPRVSAFLRSLALGRTRKRRLLSMQRLRRERGRLCDELLQAAADLELPGAVLADGRIAALAPGAATTTH